MKRAPRLPTDVVSGALGFAAFGFSIEGLVEFAAAVTAAAVCGLLAVEEPAFTPFMPAAGCAAAVVAFVGAWAAAGFVVFPATVAVFAGASFVQLAVGFVASATPPTIFADEDDEATTWRKNQPTFAFAGGDFGAGFAGMAASFGAADWALVIDAGDFIGVVIAAFALLAITGGVTVVRAWRSENDALAAGAAGFAAAGTGLVVAGMGFAVVTAIFEPGAGVVAIFGADATSFAVAGAALREAALVTSRNGMAAAVFEGGAGVFVPDAHG
jgi:hypothetical protein